MSGPIVRKYGFPNFEKIFGPRDPRHGIADPPEPPSGTAAPDDPAKAIDPAADPAPTRPAPGTSSADTSK